MSKNILSLFVLLLCVHLLPAQRLADWLQAADSSYAEKDYYSAFMYYGAALEYDSTLTEAWYYRGQAAYLFNDLDEAVRSFEQAMVYDEQGAFADVPYWLGAAYQKDGWYQKAIEAYQMVINTPDKVKPSILRQAEKNKTNCEWALRALNVSSNAKNIHNIGSSVNTGFSEFGGYLDKTGLYFSAYKFPFKKDKHRPERNLIKLMRYDSFEMQEAVLLEGPFNVDDQHTAYNTFGKNKQRMYYCHCEFVNVTDVRCDIYFRERNADGNWSAETKLGINQPDYTTTQPSIAYNPNTGEERLYFVSDRPGGEGKLDIWYGNVEADGNVLSAQNLSAINTEENDISPFYHELSRQFFFSSESYDSYGGYDVFQTTMKDGAFSTPRNLGLGINSSYDDTHFSIDPTALKGVFSSNRPSDSLIYLDPGQEVCCYDLYSVDFDNTVDLEVYTYNKLDSTPLPATEVALYAEAIAQQRFLNPLKTEMKPNDNYYRFEIERYKGYDLRGIREFFLADSNAVTQLENDFDADTIRKNLYLTPLDVDLRAITLDADDGSNLMGCTVELWRIDGADSTLLRKEMKLDTNIFDYKKISLNVTYYIKASKKGYESVETELYFTIEDIIRLGRFITVELPLPRINFDDFLPLALYFDNAVPDRRSYVSTTDKNFEDLALTYGSRAEDFYQALEPYLAEGKRFEAQRYYQIFFQREVVGGYEGLSAFSQKLLVFLEKGKSLDMEFKGYCSPLASSAYNQLLSERRVNSIKNFFYHHLDGAFQKYIDNGQLRIEGIAFGESKAGKDIPDTVKPLLEFFESLLEGSTLDRNSRTMDVYGLPACVERRVEIVQINTENENN